MLVIDDNDSLKQLVMSWVTDFSDQALQAKSGHKTGSEWLSPGSQSGKYEVGSTT